MYEAILDTSARSNLSFVSSSLRESCADPTRKFFNRFVKQQKSDIIDDDGNVILKDGVAYNEDGVRALY